MNIATCGYVRISRKDGDKAESDSIGNQRQLIKNFVSQNPEFDLRKIYVDDDYSGTNFDRPGFKEMMLDIEAGKTKCIIVKDLSRFGRDYIDVGNYLQKVYPRLGIRFISIGDNIDSGTRLYDVTMPMKNIFNEQYARDISGKVIASLRTKQASGQFIGAFASYGYFKDAKQKGKLVVDPFAAEVVRRIFAMYVEGKGKKTIANALNQDGILCPSEYKKVLEENYHNANKLNTTTYWTYSTIHNILKNEIYRGNMVQHKSDFSRYRGVKTRYISKENWIVVENTHEAIISEDTWLMTQELLQRRTRDMGLSENVSIFAGFLKCGDCQRAMSKIRSSGRTRYVCGTYKSYSPQLCSSHRIFEDELEEIVLTCINEKLSKIQGIIEFVEKRQKNHSTQRNTQMVKQRITKLENEIEKTAKLKRGLYEDYKTGLLSSEEYLSYKEQYQKQEDELKAQRDALCSVQENDFSGVLENPWIKYFKEHGKIQQLDRAVLELFIEKITIYEGNRLNIEYKFDVDSMLGFKCS